MENTNKVVLITGCANGIGNHLAHCFYKNKDTVIATDIDFEALKTAFNTPNTEGVLTEKLDVTNAENWQIIIEKIKKQFGRLDICINNAGVIIPAFVSEMEIQTIDLQLNVNIKGVIYGTKYAADLMAEQGFGHIINFSSLAGVAPIHGLAIYSATKHAVRAFTLSVVPELRAKGIHLSVICPDLVNTNMLTLQLDYKAAALTFSGDTYLTVNDIEKAIFKRALQNKEVEIMIPRMRGITAKIGNLFPSIGFYLMRVLEKKGLKKQAKFKK